MISKKLKALGFSIKKMGMYIHLSIPINEDSCYEIATLPLDEPLLIKAYIEKAERDGYESLLDTCDCDDMLGFLLTNQERSEVTKGTIRECGTSTVIPF